MRGARICPRTRARSPIGPIRGSAATAPRPNIRIEVTEVPLTPSWRAGEGPYKRRHPGGGRDPPSRRLSVYGKSGAVMPIGCVMQAVKWIPAFAGITRSVGCRAVLVLILALAALPARAEDLAAVVAGLGGDSFAAKEKAIVALGKTGDPRAVPILEA